MPRQIIQPANHWDPSPRFAQVAKHGKHVYVAGQVPVDAEGKTVGKGDIEAQARQVFENVKKCLQAAGATFQDVVKINTYSTDIANHQPVVARVRKEHFPGENVPSTYVEVSRLVDADWLLEVEAIAILD